MLIIILLCNVGIFIFQFEILIDPGFGISYPVFDFVSFRLLNHFPFPKHEYLFFSFGELHCSIKIIFDSNTPAVRTSTQRRCTIVNAAT